MKSIALLLYGANKFNQAYGPEGWAWIVVILIALVVLALMAAIPTIIAKCYFNKSDEECSKIFIGSAAVCFIACLIF